MRQTVFERVGGFAVVRKIVSAFYDSVLESPVYSIILPRSQCRA